MAIGTPLAFGNTIGTGNATVVPSFNLPTGITDGSTAYMIVGSNVTGTATFPTPSGWTAVDTNNNGANTANAALFKRTVNSADSGTAITDATCSVSGRICAGGVVAPGADASTYDDLDKVNLASASDLSFPNSSPTVADDLLAALAFQTFGTTASTTVDSPWTKLGEYNTANASGNKFGALAATRQLTGGAGTTQAGPVTHKGSAGGTIGWQIALKPTGATPPASGFSTRILGASGVETVQSVRILGSGGVETVQSSTTQ